jgi:hypothetical protein
MPGFGDSTSSGQLVPGGGLTIQELAQRQRDLLAQQMNIQGQQQPTVAGGIGQMLQAFTTGRNIYNAQQQEIQGRQALSQIISRMNTQTGEFANPQDAATAAMLDPELATSAIGGVVQAARQKALQQESEQAALGRQQESEQFQMSKPSTPEQWVIYGGQHGAYGDLSDPDNQKKYQADLQQAVSGGQKAAAAAATAGTGAQDFINNIDSITTQITAGNLTGINFPAAWVGRGDGGTAYRQIQGGLDALQAQMLQAGKTPAEIHDTISRLTPSLTDDPTALQDKVNGIKAELDNLAKWLPNQPKAVPRTGSDSAADTSGLPHPQTTEDYNALPNGARYVDPDDGVVRIKGKKSGKPGATQ